MTLRPSTLLTLFGLAAALTFSCAAQAQTPIKMELNKLEAREDACRAYFVIENGTGSNFEKFVLDLYLFGTDGVIAKRVAVDAAPLPARNTRVTLVDLREVACDTVGMVLVNNVIDCIDGVGEKEDCVGMLELSTRTGAKFIK